MKLRKIFFKNNEYVLTGENEGAIATKEQYENGLCSFAQLMPNGDILRFNEKIGTINDIVFGEFIDIEIKKHGIDNILLGMINPLLWPMFD